MSAARQDSIKSETADTIPTDAAGFFEKRQQEARKTGFAGNLTVQQQNALDDLKKLLFDPSFAFAADAKRETDGDLFFLRFLRATMKDKRGERVFDAKEAFARLGKMYAWRKEYEIDQLQKSIDSGVPPEGFERFRDISPALDVVNPETGELLRFGMFGRFVSQVDTSLYTEREWIRWFAYDFLLVLNILRQQSRKHGHEISTHHSVPDVSGISLIGIMQRIKFIQLIAQIAADYFPELIEANYFIRCPWIFAKCFAAVRPFLDKDTVSKFVMTSDVPTALFERIVPRKLLPKDYGGEADVPLVIPFCSRGKE